MVLIRWFLSGTVRQAVDLKKQVVKLLHAQKDILKAEDIAAIQTSVNALQAALAGNADKATLGARMSELEKVATSRLKPYPEANMRENVEVILVAIAVALAIRTFFLQPFKIPTGSMQPTLMGINHDRVPADEKIPAGWDRFKEVMAGVSYVHEVAPEKGRLDEVGTPWPPMVFSIFQTYSFNGKKHIIWFPPEYGTSTLQARAGVFIGQEFDKGEDIFKLRVVAGDHLFVDRLTYNFRHPTRGEIIVFATLGIKYPGVPEDQFYIKRLVGLPNERVRISDDKHLVINGEKLDAATPRFENVYSFAKVGVNGRDGQYDGHVLIQQGYGIFADSKAEYTVGKNRLLVMGDNTHNSLDSRYWGDFSQENVMGKSAFVYWPLSKRFGWSHR